MDFGDILSKWENSRSRQVKEKKTGNSSAYRAEMEKWLESHDVTPKEIEPEDPTGETAGKRERERILRMGPQAEIDLHGRTAEEALTELDRFVRESHSRGIKKIQVITGKGLHSSREPVLRKVVHQYIEKSPLCGEFGFADKKNGGRGAYWAALRYRSR